MSALCGFPTPDQLEPRNEPGVCDSCGQGPESGGGTTTYPQDGKVYNFCWGCIYAAASYWPHEAQRKRDAERNTKRNARRRELRKERRQVMR